MNRQPLLRNGVIIFAMMAVGAIAAPPAWWSSGPSPVINPAATPNNKGAATIGQAKWMAKQALVALNTVNPTVASAIEADLVGVGKPIASWDAPTTPVEQTAMKGALVIGQLKAISAPFYTHLHNAYPTWLEQQRTENGTQNAGTHFPWTTTPADDNNRAIATIGQLKAVFSLRFEELVNADSDNDGLPDAWELAEFGEIGLYGANDDPDGDGLTNLQEYLAGTKPWVADTDGDGIPDRSDSAPLSPSALLVTIHTRLEDS